MNHHVQALSKGNLKGYPVYVETTKRSFDLNEEKKKILAIMAKKNKWLW